MYQEMNQIKKRLLEKPVLSTSTKKQDLESLHKKREFSQKIFYFNPRPRPTKEEFNVLNESLRKSKFLREVEIDLSDERIFGENGVSQEKEVFKKLGKSFRQLASLKVLKFKSTADFGDDKLEFLSRHWKHLSGIETLHIQYQLTGQNRQFPPHETLSNQIKRFQSLKHLYLSLHLFHPEVIDLAELACTLRRLPRLEGVHLDLRCRENAEPNAWKKFSDSLKKIPNLQTLKFRIIMAQQTEIIRLSQQYICEALRELDSLREISLNFNGNSITDEMVLDISNTLERHLSLQKITLLFPNCEMLTNEGLIRLNQVFARLSHLKEIFLNLNLCYDLDDTYLNSLGDSLTNLPCFENLKLWIIWCRKMSEEALENFDQKLKNIKSLKSIIVRT